MLAPVLLGEVEPPGPGLAGLQVELTHDAADELGAAGHAPPRELGMDAPVTVGLVRDREGVDHEHLQSFTSVRGQ